VNKEVLNFKLPLLVFSGFLAVMIFLITLWVDPQKNILMGIILGANFWIISFGLFLLYERSLLLSPAMALCFNLPYYSFGNIGALASTDIFINANPGTLDYYPLAGALSLVGLLVYMVVYFRVVGAGSNINKLDSLKTTEVNIKTLDIKMTGVIFIFGIAVLILAYLSGKYLFIGGYFREIETQFDRFLAGMMYSFVFLGGILGVSGIAKQKRYSKQIVCVLVVIVLILIQVSLRSRTTMLFLLFCLFATWLSVRPEKLNKTLILGAIFGVIIFFAGTIVKNYSVRGETFSIKDNIIAVLTVDKDTAITANRDSLRWVLKRRTAGLELSSTILKGFDEGAPKTWGNGFLSSATGFLPQILRPKGNYSERVAIHENFRKYGMIYADLYGVAVATGLSEFGYIGVIPVYIFLACWHALMWRIAGRSKLLFLSYLAHLPILLSVDLVWDGFFSSLRLWLLCYAILWLIQPFINRSIRWKREVLVHEN